MVVFKSGGLEEEGCILACKPIANVVISDLIRQPRGLGGAAMQWANSGSTGVLLLTMPQW